MMGKSIRQIWVKTAPTVNVFHLLFLQKQKMVAENNGVLSLWATGGRIIVLVWFQINFAFRNKKILKYINR